MALGRISGPLLKANLIRDGVDLAFETDLLYLDVVNGRIGINTATPTHDLQVVGTTRTTNLEVTNQADIATFTFLGNVISSTDGTISLEPSGTNPVVYQAKIQTGDLQLSTNVIETLQTDQNLVIKTLGTGQVNVNANMFVDGDIHATGNITADGDITIGNTDGDSIIFKADIASNLIPNITDTYDLGTSPDMPAGKEWRTVYSQNLVTTNITSDTAVVNGVDLVLPQGNTIYVAKNGSDTNAGVHENNPLLTVKAALAQAVAGDTVMIYAGEYEELFPLTVPTGVTVRGAGIRAVNIKPTTATSYNDAFLLNGETTVEDLTVSSFYSGGNFFTVTSASAGSVTFNSGIAPFAHTYVSGGTVTVNGTSYPVLTATYDYTTGVTTVTHAGGIATGQIFLSNLTFSCNGSTRVFPDNGYAFRFANNFEVTSRSPYIRNCTVITKGSVTSESDPLGFDQGDAGKGAYIDGAYALATSKEASMLFHSVTFITPNVDTITAKNGVRVEWLNSFTYFANKGINAFVSNYGFARQGKTRLRIDTRTGTWAVGNTLSYYDTDGTTVLGTGTIDSIDGNYVNLTGRCTGFETITDRVGKTVYAQGGAKLSTSIKKFGTASLELNGTTDYATVASTPDFAYGTDDFTVELWWYSNNIASAQQYLIDQRTSASEAAILLYCGVTGIIRLYVNGANQIVANTTVTINTWNHVAISRESGITKMFINGVLQTATYTDSNNYAAKPLYIGASYLGTLSTNGFIDDLRITKGVAKYTSNFTVPSTALTSDLDTVLMLHFNGTNGSTQFVDDGITFQDLRTSAGGTANLINFADYSDFGAEIRSIGSANVYGNYGTYGDGQGVVIYLISQNYAYVGAGKLSTNDPNDRVAANEVVELNRAEIYYTSVDNEGNFSVGDSFYVNQKTGDVLFGGQALNITALSGITFSDGTNTTTITATNIDTGNIRISGNTVESLTGDLTITAANGEINLQNNTYVTGNVDIIGDLTLGGNIQLGDNPADIIDFVGSIGSNIIPSQTATYNLGQGGVTPLRWNNVYLGRAEIDGVVIDNNTISTTVGNDDLKFTAAGTGRIYMPSNDVQFDQNLTINTDLTVTTGTTYLKNVGVTGTITHIGDLNQTGNFTTTGLTQVTGNIVGSGYLDLPQIHIEGNTIATKVSGTDLELQANGTGDVIFEGYKITDNNIQATATNADVILTPQGTGSVIVNSNQSLVIPVGTTAERPATGTETNGMIRYNTTLGQYEGWNGTYWLKLSGVQDVDGNTYIKAEATPGANDNTLYFYADNNLMVTIDSTKLFAERLQTNNLDIQNNTITTLLSNSDIVLATPGTGGVKIGNLQIRNNTVTNTVSGAVTEFTEAGTGYVKFSGTNGVVIPSGNNATRPNYAITGMTRFNTELGIMEVWNGLTWVNVAGTSSGVTYSEATDIGIGIVLTLG